MPAVFRSLALLGATFYLSFGCVNSVHAQTDATSSLPPVAMDPSAVVIPPAPVPAAPQPAPVAQPEPPQPQPAVPAATSAAPQQPVLLPELGTQPQPATETPNATKVSKSQNKAHHVSKKHKSSKHKSSKHKAAKSSGDARVREAQEHLINLGYLKDKADGKLGPKTKAAIKKFQKEHKLKPDGKLGRQTYDAIIAADKVKAMSALPMPVEAPPAPPPLPPATPDFYAQHPDFYGYYNHSYENPVQLGSPQVVPSRFARLELTEDQTPGTTRRYTVTLNGLPLILVDNQPAVIGVSKTFAIGSEDAIIFTSFKDNDPVCAYTYHLLVLSANNTKSLELHNCTRGYQAKVAGDSLMITFPESDDGRPVGATWRY